MNTVTQKTYALSDQNSKGRSSIAYDSSFPDFTNVRVGNVDVINNEAGVYQTTAADVEGSQTLDNALRTIYDVQRWVPSEFSALQRKGGSQSEAPYVRYAPVKTQFYVAMTDILSKAFVEPRVLGAFASDRPSLQYSVIEDNGVKKLVILSTRRSIRIFRASLGNLRLYRGTRPSNIWRNSRTPNIPVALVRYG